MKSKVLGILSVMALLGGNLFAGPQIFPAPQFNPVNRLLRETQQLNQNVRMAGLPYDAQDASFRFLRDVENLADCQYRNGDLGGMGGVSQFCARDLQQVQVGSHYVRQVLYRYHAPMVMQQLRQVEMALQNLQVGGGWGGGGHGGGGGGWGGGGRLIECIAADHGWEEHGGGHKGYGRNPRQAQNAAIMECQRFHGRCEIRRCN